MSLKYLNHFYFTIYNLLCADKKIKQNLQGVYTSLAKESEYPFLVINIIQIKDIVNYSISTYQIKFEINIFSRDKTLTFLTDIADYISILLQKEITFTQDYQVLGIYSGLVNFIPGADLLSLKMQMNFEALIQKKGE